MKAIGLYLHVPFCSSKCPYCDFYSMSSPTPMLIDDYTDALMSSVARWARTTDARADTVYLGGGTPSLLGANHLSRLLRCVWEHFSLPTDAEVTMEVNPSVELTDVLTAFYDGGGNRLSVGMQSADDEELRLLGRTHRLKDVVRTVQTAHNVGIDNVSLDLMLGVSGSTIDSVRRSVDTVAELGARHVSAYMLKIEKNTPFGRCTPSLPDDDMTADMYLAAMERLDERGYAQYEISNTALRGYESRHNLKYWLSDPYIGIGPAASSYYSSARFTYPRDIAAFMHGDEPARDEDTDMAVGSMQEFACLRLRLRDGVEEQAFFDRFGSSIPDEWRVRASALPGSLIICDEKGIRLTRQGYLVSNLLIRHIFDR